MVEELKGIGSIGPSLEEVRCALSLPLPGVAAQVRMAPQPRPGWKPDAPLPSATRMGSVLILLYPRTGRLTFVLTCRTETVRFHKGQISLPGGAREKSETLVEAALRETHEELGVPRQGIEILGELSPLHVPPSNYCIHPFVAHRAAPPTFRADSDEVLEVLEVPLALLLDPSVRRVIKEGEPAAGPFRRKPFFAFHGRVVWGATAMILMELAVLLEGG